MAFQRAGPQGVGGVSVHTGRLFRTKRPRSKAVVPARLPRQVLHYTREQKRTDRKAALQREPVEAIRILAKMLLCRRHEVHVPETSRHRQGGHRKQEPLGGELVCPFPQWIWDDLDYLVFEDITLKTFALCLSEADPAVLQFVEHLGKSSKNQGRRASGQGKDGSKPLET